MRLLRLVSVFVIAAVATVTSACVAGDADADGPASDEDALATCAVDVTTAARPLATATESGEQVLTIDAASKSATSWAEKGNEAVVLEVLRGRARVGHLVLHQGASRFTYAMHVGALAKGDALTVRVSPLTAPRAKKAACIAGVSLAPPPAAIADGVAHAPVVKWPTEKSFDDLPVVLGWSKRGKSYELVYTNENGGTAALCGGGARGMRSEIQRWGRGVDIEGVYGYGGEGHFERCTGVVAPKPGAPRMIDAHPILYYGDGHNRVFESRGGYGNACGTGSDKTPDGALEGWNAREPGDDLAHDDPYTIVLRPVPVPLDGLASRESMLDVYAPWLYRVEDAELRREGKVDEAQTLSMSRYLYVDVYAKDVGGSGDATCGSVSWLPGAARVQGGFKLRAVAKNGVVSSSEQMTADFFHGTVKRMAIPLAAGVTAADIDRIVLDAYDGDGIYFLGVGDAFVAEPSGPNGAALRAVNQGFKAANVYVDDDRSGCVNGESTKDGVSYPCAGSSYSLRL